MAEKKKNIMIVYSHLFPKYVPCLQKGAILCMYAFIDLAAIKRSYLNKAPLCPQNPHLCAKQSRFPRPFKLLVTLFFDSTRVFSEKQPQFQNLFLESERSVQYCRTLVMLSNQVEISQNVHDFKSPI